MSGLFHANEPDTQSLLTTELAMFTTDRGVAAKEIAGTGRRAMLLESERPPDAKSPMYTRTGAPGAIPFRSGFLDWQYRREKSVLGVAEAEGQFLKRLEATFCEPVGNTIGDSMDRFWLSWKSLADTPAAQARRHVREEGGLLACAFRRASQALDELADCLHRDLESRTSLINDFAAGLADLNRRIASAEAAGQAVPGLRQRRSRILDRLARLSQVRIEETYTGAANVSIGDTELVHAGEYRRLLAVDGHPARGRDLGIVWEYSGCPVSFAGGEVGGLIRARDTWLPETQNALDALARCLVTAVNELHRRGAAQGGLPGADFFDPLRVTARLVQLHGRTADNWGEEIVVGRTGARKDVDMARAQVGLAERAVMPDGCSTFKGFYDSVVSTIRARRAAARDVAEAQNMLVEQLAIHRRSDPGASLDLELANMIKLQHASLAAARVITTMDEALNTVVEGMGIVGR